MENLKIRVNSKTTKEAVKLLKKLGYHAHCKASEYIANGATWLIAERDQYDSGYDYVIEYSLPDGAYTDSNHKEVSLLELRALVSLHKNPINMDKVLSEVRSDASGLLKDKEYLRRNAGGTYSYVGTVHLDHVHDLLIEIPEGAIKLVYSTTNNNHYHFVNNKNQLMSLDDINNNDGYWYGDAEEYISIFLPSVVWSRHAQPEELPFLDGEANWSQIPESMHDSVNHPSHYASGEIECIDAIESSMTHEAFCGYLKGNVQKYMWRYENKGGLESLEKAQWYLNKLISRIS